MKYWQALQEKIDALSIKERGLICAASALILFMLWQTQLIDPMQFERSKIRAAIDEQRQLLEASQMQIGAIRARANIDPDAADKARLKEIRVQAAEADQQITVLAANLIAPADMAMVLERVLSGMQALQLVEVRGLGATALLGGAESESEDTSAHGSANDGAGMAAWKHGVRITVQGSYLDTLAYLRALEALPWRFLWDELVLEVSSYPRSEVSIVVYTLSLDKRWIGV